MPTWSDRWPSADGLWVGWDGGSGYGLVRCWVRHGGVADWEWVTPEVADPVRWWGPIPEEGWRC